MELKFQETNFISLVEVVQRLPQNANLVGPFLGKMLQPQQFFLLALDLSAVNLLKSVEFLPFCNRHYVLQNLAVPLSEVLD